MLDIMFDITTREIQMSDALFSGDEDFLLQDNPSVQNGGILMYGRAFNLDFPMAGIGAEENINAPASKMAYEANRWQQMAKADGATIAKWTTEIVGLNQINIHQQVSYL